MFNLIITVISIALVAALAVSSLYFGGDAFNEGSEKAKAATVVNQAQQIDGANTLYRLDEGSYATGLGELTPDYLDSAPSVDTTISTDGSDPAAASTWQVAGEKITLGNITGNVCRAINGQVIDNPAADSFADENAIAGNHQYGCYGGAAGSASGTFVFNPAPTNP
jgi:hypothetical protein